MRKLRIIGIISALLIFCINHSFACTIIKITKNGVTLIGNNEDGTDPTTYLWFIPPSNGKYGRVYFTLSDKWPQGGMNDQGLFYDGTAGPIKEILKSADKPVYNGNLSEKMLEECATVDEAVSLFSRFNLRYFFNGQMMLADRFGNSAIIEGDTIIYASNDYQIATNFYQSNPSMGGYPCYRYDVAETLIKNMSALSMRLVQNILQAVHLEGYSFTQYSEVYDLNKRVIHYYKDSDFSRYIAIDLEKELKEGERWFETKAYFQKRVPDVKREEGPHTKKIIRNYYMDDGLKCRISISDGLLNGLCEGFYENGQVAWRIHFEDGKVQGTVENWTERGRPLRGYKFTDPKYTDLLEYFPNGSPLLQVSLSTTDIDKIVPKKIKVFNEDGSCSFSGEFIDGLLFPLACDQPFSGPVCALFLNRRRHFISEYQRGILDGITEYRNKKGQLIKMTDYRDGRPVRVQRYLE